MWWLSKELMNDNYLEKGMNYFVFLFLCVLCANPLQAAELFDNQDKDYIHIWEIERIGDVSKVGIDAVKRASSVGDSMYLAIAVGKIGKLRNFKFMTILSYNSKEKPHYHYVGFSNRADIDPNKLWPEYIKKGKKVKVIPVTMFDRIETLSKRQKALNKKP